MRKEQTRPFLLLAGMLALMVALAWALGLGFSQAQDGRMHNCPQPSKWAMAVWDGPNTTDAEEALATCGTGAVDAAYYLDPGTQRWSRWLAGQPELSSLTTLNDWQAVIALGSATAPTPTPWATPATKWTALARAVSAGATEIQVVDPTGFVVSDTIFIGRMATQEVRTITAISADTFTLDSALQFDHAPGEDVVVYQAAPPLEPSPTATATPLPVVP